MRISKGRLSGITAAIVLIGIFIAFGPRPNILHAPIPWGKKDTSSLKIIVNPDGKSYDAIKCAAHWSDEDTNRYFYRVYEMIKDGNIIQHGTQYIRCARFPSHSELVKDVTGGDKSKSVIILFTYEFANSRDYLNAEK